jgi:hypothetical protein
MGKLIKEMKMKQIERYVLVFLLLISSLVLYAEGKTIAGVHSNPNFNLFSLENGDYSININLYNSSSSTVALYTVNYDGASKPLLSVRDRRFMDLDFAIPRELLSQPELWAEAQYHGAPAAPRILINRHSLLLESTDAAAVGLEIGQSGEDSYFAANKVGIRTTTPAEKLEVAGNVKATAFMGDGTNLTGLFKLDAADGSPTNALYVDASGNVGIATTTPGAVLDVIGGVMFGTCTSCSATNEGTIRYNSSTKIFEYCDGSAWKNIVQPPTVTGCVFRWNVWDTYSCCMGSWFFGNNSDMQGGVNPSSWSGGYYAWNISSDKQLQQTLFNKKGYVKYNGMVYSEEYKSPTQSTDAHSKHCAALFRIKNVSSSAISWTIYFYHTSYGGWSEYASVTLNGASNWSNTGNAYPGTTASVTLSIPAQRTSTVIVISSATPQNCGCCTQTMRGLYLCFYNNSLALPTNLYYVDDLDVATGDWNY